MVNCLGQANDIMPNRIPHTYVNNSLIYDPEAVFVRALRPLSFSMIEPRSVGKPGIHGRVPVF